MGPSELSPLKQFQRMKENGTMRILPKVRNRVDGNHSDPCESGGSDRENKNYLRSLTNVTMSMVEGPTGTARRNSSIGVVGSADLNGAGASLLQLSSDVRHSDSTLAPADSNGNVSTCTESSVSSRGSGTLRGESRTKGEKGAKAPSDTQASDSKAALLAHLMGEPIYAPRPIVPVITPPQHPSSRRKPPIPPTITITPLEKPSIEVKLVKNDRPMSCRISKSADDLDRCTSVEQKEPEGKFLRHAGSNLRNSFIDRNRESMCNNIGDVQTILKTHTDNEEEAIYSLPQPQSYSDNTLKAVKKITDKYDTLQMRKLRALSFRESNKSGGSEPNSPTTVDPDQKEAPKPQPPQPPVVPVQKAQPKPALPPLPPPRATPARPVPEAKPLADILKAKLDQSTDDDCAFSEGLERNTEGDEVVCVSSGITQRDVARIELFYRSRETEVVVCQCLVDMTMGTVVTGTGEVSAWSTVCHTGVPVLVLNTGLGKRRRELFMVLSERETGFPLWQDKVNYLTNYKDVNPTRHQMQPSNNLRLRVGFRFYCANAASEFQGKYREMTVDPHDDLWKVANVRPDKKKRQLIKKLRLKKKPAKTDISQPCNFAHVTKVNTKDHVLYESFQDLVQGSPQGSPLAAGSAASTPTSIFRPRLQTT